MSETTGKRARKARAAGAKPGTIAADHRLELREKVDLGATIIHKGEESGPQMRQLAAEEFAHLPLFVVASKLRRRALVWRSGDGRWWRRGGAVRIQSWPTPNGERAFVVFLHRGANRDDLTFLLDAVDRARRGVGIDSEWGRVTSGWADELTFRLEFASRPYVDPYTHSDRASRVAACADPACREQWHDEWAVHTLDSVSRKLPERRGHYNIRVSRAFDEDQWTVDVHTDEFFGTSDDVAGFVSDLQWMNAECRRANEPARAPLTVLAEAVA